MLFENTYVKIKKQIYEFLIYKITQFAYIEVRFLLFSCLEGYFPYFGFSLNAYMLTTKE